MANHKDPLRVAVSLAAFITFYIAANYILSRILSGIAGPFAAALMSVFLCALFANWLALRIYENLPLRDAGIPINRASGYNLGFGILGGVGAASLVLGPPLLFGAAHLLPVAEAPSAGTLSFVTLMLAAGAAGEELLFRGYGFQLLMAAVGPFAAIIPVGVFFGLMHSMNPNATWFGTANTAGFGILFGYAYYRTRDLWLPIGLHFGWNFTLPLFGVNVSGLRIGMTGHEMVWSAGALWSGGDYGPEASVLTSGALVLLGFYLWKAPFRRQTSPLTGPAAESAPCEPLPRLPS
jgi:membrane protease YdiL (CAAX protease family)